MDTSVTMRRGRVLILPDEIEVSKRSADEKKGDDVVKETLELWAKGEKEIKLDEKYRDAIMILGNTGSGKTTFIRWIAGDDTKLISRETEEGSDDFIIVGPGISNDTLKSKTVFPELVIDAKRKAAHYDCPGFSDTQGTSHEIAGTYFVKKVVDFLKRIKMVFIINHSSVRKGVERQDFMKFLRHITDLVKDIKKFKPSIAMVVTKVENQYVKKGKKLKEDNKVIAEIASFLLEAKQYLEVYLKPANHSEKEKRFHENAIKFVEILLEKEGENYPRIGIFRKPDMKGRVSDIPLLQKGRQGIEKMLYEKIDFTAKNNRDFGYTVSDRAKNDINDIVKEINKNLWSRLSNIAEKIQEYSKNLVQQIRDKIQLFVSAVNFVEANPSEAKALRYKFISAYNSTSDLVSKTTNLTNPEQLAQIVNSTISDLKIDTPKDDILHIATQGSYFNFLKTVSDRIFSSKAWNKVFQDVKTFLSGSKTVILRDVDAAAKNISAEMQITLNDTIKLIRDEYTNETNSLEIEKLPHKLKGDHQMLFKLTKELKNKTTTEKLVNAARYFAESLKVTPPKQNLENITNLGKYFEFLEIIKDKPLNINPVTWPSPFENLVQYLKESEKWYLFLQDLYNKFSEYDVQKDRQRYNVADLEHWGQPDKPQGISITPETFEKFLEKIRKFNVTEYETIKKLAKTTDLQIEEINQSLRITLKHRPNVRCSEPYVTVKGSFIVLKDTMNNLISNSGSNNSCTTFKTQLTKGKYDLLKVFSSNRVFIDSDVSFSGKGISVAILSPEWEVVGSRRVDLRGAVGPPPAERKAKNGTTPGQVGAKGVPGNPGSPGGSFFGIGSVFVGGKNLKINLDGGRGGQGQDGGDGAPGKPGRPAEIPEKDDSEDSCKDGSFREFKCEQVGEPTGEGGVSSVVTYRYKFHGLPGVKGSKGGDGGKGGKGAPPGKIRLVELSRPSEIRNTTSAGKEGAFGIAGSGGEGGENGDDKLADFELRRPSLCNGFGCFIETWLSRGSVISSRAPSGADGRNGTNNSGRKDPAPAKGISNVPMIINEYKMYLRENTDNRFTKRSRFQFLEQLNKSSDVRSLYDILALIDEFKGLEEQFHKLSEQVDFSTFYNSLQERISEFAKNLKKGPNSSESKKALNYLYTATLGRIRHLRENFETSLITDIRTYLNIIKENIKNLKDVERQNSKVDIINKTKKNYKESIDKKINEAMYLIKNTVSPEIGKINAKIDKQVNTLISEVISLQNEKEKDVKELEKKKKELEKSLSMKILFGSFRIIGGLVQFLGPTGKIAGAVLETASAVGEAFVLDQQKTPINLPPNIASSAKEIVGQIRSIRNKKVDFLQKPLDDISEEIKKNPEKLGDMEGKINNIKDKLKKASENKLDYEQVQTLENDLNKELKRKGDDLKSNPNDKKSEEALKVIEKMAEVLDYGSVLLDVYDKIKEEKDKMGVVDDAMKNLKGKLRNLIEYEHSIYETMVPMLNEMIEHIKDVTEKIGTKSQVALDVTKWQVQSNLKDMRSEMKRLVEGFSVKDDLSRSIEKLDEVMTALITIYDRIQSYQDQKHLADYIGDISSVAASKINIKNQQLVKAVNHLEFVIRANMVLEQYKSAIGALRQWAFPFPDQYIAKSMLPSEIEEEKNIDDLVQSASEQIEAIEKIIRGDDSSVKRGDERFQCEEFSSRYESSRPFFVWKNEDFGDLISDLLLGKEVVLKADVQYSSPDKEAIKFNEVDFYMKVKNETAQASLSEVLKGFDMEATHLGNSNYRFENKTFLITSDSVTIKYSYERDEDGKPIRKDEIYDMLQKGNLLLSPYALWQIRITKQTNRHSFKDLEKFKKEVDLELSGFGSYVDANLGDVPTNSTQLRGVNQCRRSKKRSERSVNDIVFDGGYVTNNAARGMSSPINFVFHFLKTLFSPKATSPANGIFVGDKRSLRIRDHCSGLPNDRAETGSIAPTVASNLMVTNTVKIVANSSGKDSTKEKIDPKPDIIFNVNFKATKSCPTPFLLNDQVKINKHCTRVPDLNCSLLLADLVTRTITGNKYKPPVDECLLSPREVILRQISDGSVRNERGIKQLLQRHLSEKEANKPSSWFSDLNGYAKKMLYHLGLIGRRDFAEFVSDIRYLFA